jgi:hypothetical protein
LEVNGHKDWFDSPQVKAHTDLSVANAPGKPPTERIWAPAKPAEGDPFHGKASAGSTLAGQAPLIRGEKRH